VIAPGQRLAGFLESSERGYSAPVFSEGDLRDRLEVKRALLPAIAAHDAAAATAEVSAFLAFLDGYFAAHPQPA